MKHVMVRCAGRQAGRSSSVAGGASFAVTTLELQPKPTPTEPTMTHSVKLATDRCRPELQAAAGFEVIEPATLYMQ